MDDDQRLAELHRLADDAGIERGYWDVSGVWHDATTDGLLAVLRILGHDVPGLDAVPAAVAAAAERRVGEPVAPVVVAWQGGPVAFDLGLPAGAGTGRVDLAVHLEAGGEVVLGGIDLADCPVDDDPAVPGRRVHRVVVDPPELAIGYHDLWIGHPAVGSLHRTLVVAPTRTVQLGPAERLWGVFAPLYALRSPDLHGPSITDLDRLGVWLDGFGGKVVATLPLLAAYLDEPYDPSPYSPVSRRFWNETYLDVARLPELVGRPQLADWLDAPEVRDAFAALADAPTYDYRAHHALRRRAIAGAAVGLDAGTLGAIVGYDPAVADYARFRAAVDRAGTGWHAWDGPARDGRLGEGDVDPLDVAFHELAQYALRRQMADLADGFAARGQRLYLDLPVGAHGDGYDTWRHRDLFAWGAAAGAPPDEFFTDGQNWGFPPLVPAASRADGHRHLRDVLHHHMAVSGILRLDHVMGLHRMYWVPDGLHAREGVYVRYPREELFAVLAVESHRHDCVVVGEDLGTVPDEVRDAMDRHGLLGMYVTEFEVASWPGAAPTTPRADQLAALDTHDTPPFAAWVAGLDVDRRRAMGLVDDDDADREHRERRQQVENLAGFLGARGDLPDTGDDPVPAEVLFEGVLRWLGDGEAPVVLVNLEDAWGETEPQNVPGTPADRPNWVHRFPAALDALVAEAPRVAEALGALQGCRLGSHLARIEELS